MKQTEQDLEEYKRKLIFQPLNSAEELRDWMYLFFDIYFPMGVVYPTSTHGPVEAMWRIYELFKTGESAEVPQVCMLSSRDSYKTLCAAALEVLCMIHFRMPCCHMAAIESQSLKAVQYVESFFRKIKPYLEHHGWKKNSDNKRMIEWITDTGVNIYLKIIVATIAGANSEHVPMLCLEGKTEILIKNTRKSSKTRSRVVATIRGIYNSIKKGEIVEAVTFNDKNGNLEFKRVTSAYTSEKDIYRMELQNGKYLDMSLDHRVFVLNKGYIPLKQIEIGDKLVVFNKIKKGIDNNLEKSIFKEFEDKYRLYRICKKHIHPSMLYKFEHLSKTCKNCSVCGKEFYTFECHNTSLYCTDTICNMIRKESVSLDQVKEIKFLRKDKVYDINTEDNHNFIANGILTHNCIDEVDVVQNPKALNEAKMIPSTYGNINPLTIYLSTRKFAGGMMEKTLKETEKSGGEVLRWNIVDVTERIPYEVAKPDLPKVVRYISRELPMENISPDEWNALTDESKNKFERFEAYAGIADHPLLPVMKHYLVGRPQEDYGFLYKRISAVRNNFRQLPPDMGEAQLLCNKPSSSGLVYSRFENSLNSLTIEQALEKISGTKHENNSLQYLRDYLFNLGVTFVGGGDFGFTDYTSLVVLALLPSGEIWLMDSVVEQRLELDDIVKYTKELQNKWDVSKWYMEQAYPAYLVTLRKNGITCPEFKKVVEDGIAALQSRIVDSSNFRKFFIIKQPNTEMALQAFGEYKWAIDGKGDVIEGKPYHDKDGVSDIMDSIRYPMQNLFSKNGKIMFSLDHSPAKPKTALGQSQELVSIANQTNENLMKEKMKELVPNYNSSEKKNTQPKKKIFWG